MDSFGSSYKCKHSHSGCPYRNCNYHIESTGKYSHAFNDDIPIHLPKSELEAETCMSYLDI